MGGSGQEVLDICRLLSEKKYRTLLIAGLSLESKMTTVEERIVAAKVRKIVEKGAQVVVVEPLVRRINPLEDIKALFSLIRLIRRHNPTIVHTHTSKAGILGRLASWLLRTPTIIHSPHGHVFHGHFPGWLSSCFLIIERVFDKITDCTVALTDGERDDYLSLHVSKPEKLAKIHSGVNIRKFMDSPGDITANKQALGILPHELVIGTVG